MAPRLTFKNITYLGLTHVGVIVAGVLGAGATFKMGTTFGLQHSHATQLAVEYGFLALVIPVLWITIAFALQHRDQCDDAPEIATYFSGWLVLGLLLVGAFQAAILPWVRLCGLSLSA